MWEDASSVRSANAPQALAALRNAALALARLAGWDSFTRARRHFGLHLDEALAFVGVSQE